MQQWLTEGWSAEAIKASVGEQVGRKRGEKIDRVEYFEKGIASFIARVSAPVAKVVELKPETVEVRREKTQSDSRSGVAAISRVYDKIRAQADAEHRDG